VAVGDVSLLRQTFCHRTKNVDKRARKLPQNKSFATVQHGRQQGSKGAALSRLHVDARRRDVGQNHSMRSGQSRVRGAPRRARGAGRATGRLPGQQGRRCCDGKPRRNRAEIGNNRADVPPLPQSKSVEVRDRRLRPTSLSDTHVDCVRL
jgi:hypothetical protein